MSNGVVILCVFSDCFSENSVMNNNHDMLWSDFSTKHKYIVKPFNGKISTVTNTTIHNMYIHLYGPTFGFMAEFSVT